MADLGNSVIFPKGEKLESNNFSGNVWLNMIGRSTQNSAVPLMAGTGGRRSLWKAEIIRRCAHGQTVHHMPHGDIAGRKGHRGFLVKSEYSGLIEDYYRIHREYGADGFLCGRVTMEGSFPQPPVHPKEYDGPPIAREDYIAEEAAFYAVAIDPKGKLWWSDRAISDTDEGYDGAHIIEVLTESVPDAFLAHLRSKGVSYLFAGKTELNLPLAVQKLKGLFGIETLLLEGGGIVNGSFLQEGLIDEISLVVIPEAEPSEKAVPLFQTGKYQAGDKVPASFRLKDAKKLDYGGLWLTYQKQS